MRTNQTANTTNTTNTNSSSLIEKITKILTQNLTVSVHSNGPLCTDIITFNCLQLDYFLKVASGQTLTFSVSRTIESDPHHPDFTAEQLTKHAFNEDKINNLVMNNQDSFFNAAKVGAACGFVSQYVQHIRFILNSSPLQALACSDLSNGMNAIFMDALKTQKLESLAIGGIIFVTCLAAIGICCCCFARRNRSSYEMFGGNYNDSHHHDHHYETFNPGYAC